MTDPDPLVGTELDQYSPLRLLGKGGMGAVYEARDLALHRTVALKVLLPHLLDDPRARERFQREINTAVAIEHPNIVPIYGAGFDAPHFYIAMRLIPGPDLARVLQEEGQLPEEQALRIVGQVASALYAMHQKGLVHRDVKPHNVLLWRPGGDDEHASLTDFGIAKFVDDQRVLTGVGAIGTPAYMAPEVALGGAATAASDQYSLACMAYEMLAGKRPFDRDGPPSSDDRLDTPPPPLATVAPRVTPAVARAIDIALSFEPASRHPDIRELVRAAKPAERAFERANAISETLSRTTTPEDTVAMLTTEYGLTDETVSYLTGVDRAELLRLRRRRARGALVGRPDRGSPPVNG